jgi:hypothetical protein
MPGFFRFRNLADAQVTACEILFLPVFLLGFKSVAPDARRAVASGLAFAIKVHRIRLPATKCRAGVTLKKNLEKLRFANHLSP